MGFPNLHESFDQADKLVNELLTKKYTLSVYKLNEKALGENIYTCVANRAALINHHGHLLLDETEVLHIDKNVEGLLEVLDYAASFAQLFLSRPCTNVKVAVIHFEHKFGSYIISLDNFVNPDAVTNIIR